jgi:uncharacterized protein
VRVAGDGAGGYDREVRPHLSLHEQAVLAAFAASLRERFGARLCDSRLFGSRARGEGRDDSDLDVFVSIAGLTRKERGEVIDLAADLGVQSGLVLSPLVVDPVAWRDDLPLARAIALEGVAL